MSAARRKPLITANMVTMARLLPMPLICWFIYDGDYWAGLVLGTLIGCTDFVDGLLARKHGPTVLGGLLDPIADKVFIAFVYLPFADPRTGPIFAAWAVAAIFVRELMVTGLRSSYERRDMAMKTSYLGKVKTWTQMQGIGMVMLFVLLAEHRAVMWGLLGAAAVAPLVAMAILWLARRRFWTGALVMSALQAPLLWMHYNADIRLSIDIILYATLAVTWISGLDYVMVGLKELRGRGDLDFGDSARLLGSIALPVLLFGVLARTAVSPWPLIAILGLELAVGGLDNLLSHHRAAAGGGAWAVRVLGTSALLGAVWALAEAGKSGHLDLVAWSAAALCLAGVAREFWRGRDYYIDARLRDKARQATDKGRAAAELG